MCIIYMLVTLVLVYVSFKFIQLLNYQNQQKKNNVINKKILLVGNISAGKTTLIRELMKICPGLRPVWEPVERWQKFPFFENGEQAYFNLFSYGTENLAKLFLFQVGVVSSFLDAHRVNKPGNSPQISERSILDGMKIFVQAAKSTNPACLDDKEYGVLHALLESVVAASPELTEYDVIIYLTIDPVALLKRIKTRGRSEEQWITLPYLKQIHHQHELWYNTGFHPLKSKFICVFNTIEYETPGDLAKAVFEAVN